MYRIAVGAISIECNSFCGLPAGIDDFAGADLLRDDDLLAMRTSSPGGMIEAVGARGHEPIGLLFAGALARGPITADAYGQLKGELLDRLEKAMPVDGVLMPLHGSGAAEGIGDIEGDLISAVRAVVGTDVPIIGTLDPHAHLTEQMVTNADALLGIETYPHDDWYETGVRAAEIMIDILDGAMKPTMAVAKVPVIVSALHGNTAGEGPFADCMRMAKSPAVV